MRKDTGALVAFRVRWRQLDDRGRRLRPSKSFSVRKLGSPDRALDAAAFFLDGAREASRTYQRRGRRPRALTANVVFAEWMQIHAVELSPDYAEKMHRLWTKEIEPRSLGDLRLKEISSDPSCLVAALDELAAEGLGSSKRREIAKLVKAVLRWGRRRHPNALTVEVAGLIEMPRYGRSRLAYAADAIGLERIIEAILNRPARSKLHVLRDAAFVAATGFSVATRPGEWRLAVTWADLHEDTVELQQRSQKVR